MCGICGELRFDGAPPDEQALARAAAALARRGPDDAGAFRDGPLAFAHRRLAVIDLSTASHQPMRDATLGLTIVFNGTIYNYRELRAELAARGHTFFSNGDTEVILKAYATWGDRCVEHFNGMFAFAIWDGGARRLFLARDRTGIKPLYYARTPQHFRFASTLPALLAGGGIDTTIDPVALHEQFTMHGVVMAPHTILRGVRKLAPACTLAITPDGNQRETRYWQLRAERPDVPRSDDEWIEVTRVACRRAVQRQYETADTPVGVLLSGGLDSSLLVGLLDEVGARDVATFSIGFEDTPEERANEFEYSDIVATRFATRHHRYAIPNREILATLPDAVAAMSEPMFSQDVVAFYLLAERVKREVKVVLSGQGADEAFGGYYWYASMEADSGSDIDRLRHHYFDRTHAELRALLDSSLQGEDFTSTLVEQRLAEPGATTFLDRILRLDMTTLIVDDPVKRVDNMTMAWGLEARVPFLDHELLELAATMPPALKLRDEGKYPLKRIARGLIPDAVIDRPKGYFPVPVLKYVRGPFLAFIRELLTSDTCRRRGLFNPVTVDRMLSEPESERLTPIGGSTLRHLALLELWFQRVVDPLSARG